VIAMATFTIVQANPNDSKIYIYPNGDLSGCTAWTANGAMPNYACVDDDRKNIDNDSTYVSMATSIYLTDLYEMQNHGSETGTINYVKIYETVRTTSPPASSMRYYIAISPDSVCTHIYFSTSQNLTTGWAKKYYLWETNPSTATDWLWADINNLSIGMKARSPEARIDYQSIFRPNGAGYSNEHFHKSGAAGNANNYTEVDDISSDDDSTYVYMPDLAHNGLFGRRIDSYSIPDHTTETGTISKITVYLRSRALTYTYLNNFWIMITDDAGTTLKYSSTFNANATWTTHSYSWTSSPFTSAAWTWADIDNLEIGFRSDDTLLSGNNLRHTQTYLVVDWYVSNGTPEIQVTSAYAEIGYTPSSTTCYLNMPEEVSADHSRNVNMINFWNGDREVYDINRSSKGLILRGKEWNTGACDRIQCVRGLGKNGATIELTDIQPEYFQGTYRIISFGWKQTAKAPVVFEWMLELEDDNA